MEFPASIGEKIQLLDRPNFIKARDEWLRPSYDLTGLKLLREKAGRERDSRELYRNRAPYELLQNADDVGARQAVFILKADGLGFAHDGQWFSVANFRSLADGWSDKDPNQCIGHKGLGFRSVLDVTPAPHVLRLGAPDFFGFKFTWAMNNGHIQETIKRQPRLREEYLHWTRHGQSACPVMAIPGEAKRQGMGGGLTIYEDLSSDKYGMEFTTLFWLPGADADANSQAVEALGVSPLVADAVGRARLANFIEKEIAVLLPFLSNLENVAVFADRQLLAQATSRGNRKNEQGDEVHVDVTVGDNRYSATFFQMHGASAIPPRIRSHTETPKAVRQLDRANFRLSVRLMNQFPVFDSSAKFHVYFPTEEPTGFGCIVHGDFYVKPDRTRLMEGPYNEWLLGLSAKRFANEFLTQLLRRYDPKSVLESLRPASAISHAAARRFQELTSSALRERSTPWVPSRARLLKAEEAGLPAYVDANGFWEDRFAESILPVTGKTAFLDPTADSDNVRKFLVFAGVTPLNETTILSLVEESAKAIRSAKWWYEIYTYLAGGKQSALWDHAKVIGRKLLPDHDLTALAIPAGIPVLCLPPKDDASIPSVPESFRSIFVFANSDLSRQLHNGPEFVRNWFVNIFHVAHFEATDLLPKAIAATVQRFYDGQIRLSPHDLGLLWEFLKEVIDLSRSIKSDAFWHTTSRLPLPVEFDSSLSDSLPIAMLVPAFACYWPDDHPNSTTAIRGVPGPRRLAPTFIPYLVQTFGHGEDEWHSLLRSAGVSGSPKRLKYVRLVGDREIPFSEELSPELALSAFSGDRQRDENLLALENICGSELWRIHVHSFSPAERSGRTLQEVNLLDRLDACTQAGADLWTEENGDWQTRMWSIVRSVSQSASIGIPDDQLFRRVGGGGGNAIPIKSFLRAQLSQLRWAPSSFGPASPTEAFLRLANRRFVSNGTLEEELGDQLVPYVVADSIEVHEMLKRLGFEPLDDTAASPTALLRFLQLVGIRLSEDGAREQILAVRSRWRLIRGAIQECYRTLNQAAITPTITPDIKLAARLSGLISFVARPVYYAEPGSPLERAFSEDLPLLDADRYYESWYEALAIRRLPGEWVTEKLVGSERAAPSSILRASIIDDLAPYLLATVIAKSEEKDHRELVLRRLKERFEVYVTDRLTIQYTLGGPEPLQRSIDFPKFYMERRVETVGTRENHYSLYVVGRDNAALADLDGDALGDALVPVFFDRVRDDLAALFPRIVSRFQSVDGSKPQMEQFLLESLGISLDSQEMARDDIAGRVEEITPLSPPPPATLLNPSPLPVSAGDSDAKLVDHKTEVIKKLERVIQGFNKNGATTGSNSTNGGKGSSGGGPTREQEARGRRGEEEFLRRIKQPGGWMTFGFVKDTRSLNVGYDFLCSQAEREVAVEIKTFAPGGRVIVTQNELRAASQYGKDYFLIGFVDVGPEAQWHSSVLRNPLSHLLEAGAFDVDVTLQVKAIDVFPH